MHMQSRTQPTMSPLGLDLRQCNGSRPRVCIHSHENDGGCSVDSKNWYVSHSCLGVGFYRLRQAFKVDLALTPDDCSWHSQLLKRQLPTHNGCDMTRKQTLPACAAINSRLAAALPTQRKLYLPLDSKQRQGLPADSRVWVLKFCDAHLSKGVQFRRGLLAPMLDALPQGSDGRSENQRPPCEEDNAPVRPRRSRARKILLR